MKKNDLIFGAIVGIVLAICGQTIFDWQFWFGAVFLNAASIYFKDPQP